MNKKSVRTDMPLKEILFDKESPTEDDIDLAVQRLNNPEDIPIVGKDCMVELWSHREYESDGLEHKSDKILILVVGEKGEEEIKSKLSINANKVNKDDDKSKHPPTIQSYFNRMIGTKLIQDFQETTVFTALEKNAIEIECKFIRQPKHLGVSITPEKYFLISIIDCSDGKQNFGDALSELFSGCSIPILHNLSLSFSEQIKQMDSAAQKNLAYMMTIVNADLDLQSQLEILMLNLQLFFHEREENLPEFCRKTMLHMYLHYNKDSTEGRIIDLRKSINLISLGQTNFSKAIIEQRNNHNRARETVNSYLKPQAFKTQPILRTGKDAWFEDCINDLANAHSEEELKADVEHLCGILQKHKQELAAVDNQWEIFNEQPIDSYIEKWHKVTHEKINRIYQKYCLFQRRGRQPCFKNGFWSRFTRR